MVGELNTPLLFYYMGKIKELQKKLMELDMEEVCLTATLAVEQQAMDMNTGQLFKGERSDGSSLPDYSFVSVNVFGKPAGPIRLFDQGDFYRGFIYWQAKFPLQITSGDWKTNELVTRYGEEIFGLNEKNKNLLAKNYILPKLKIEFLKAMDV